MLVNCKYFYFQKKNILHVGYVDSREVAKFFLRETRNLKEIYIDYKGHLR